MQKNGSTGWLTNFKHVLQWGWVVFAYNFKFAIIDLNVFHLQGVTADIKAHENAYRTLCSKCQELIGQQVQDSDELQHKLESLEQRWNALQVVTDDIEAIEDTVPKLENFYSTYRGHSSSIDEILQKARDFCASSTSMEGIEAKRQQLQVLSV